uniref:CCHC-type domain-containing protein n=1 Tax=Caenorhabditis japonica TaxID=281687 RepID=A0A8R1EJC8_CAEJA
MATPVWTKDARCFTGNATVNPFEAIGGELAVSQAAAAFAGNSHQASRSPMSSGTRARAAGPQRSDSIIEKNKSLINPTTIVTCNVGSNAEENPAHEQLVPVSNQRESDPVTIHPSSSVRGHQVQHVMSDVVQAPASEQHTLNPEVRSEPGTINTKSNTVVGHHVPYVNVANFKSSVTINAYSGAFSESLTNFVRQFKDHTMASDANASAATRKYSFLTFLTGNARDRAEDFMAVNPEATVDQIIADLKSTFENELTGQLKEKQYKDCRQWQGESIEAFYNRVRTLASQAFQVDGRELIEKKTRDAFLDGLEDSIRYNVKNKNPSTSRAAFDEALRQEILRDDRAAAQQCLPTAAIFEEIRVLNDKWDNHHSQQRKPKFQGECFFCGISGHTSRDCRRRLNGYPRIENEQTGQSQTQPSSSQRNTVATDRDIQAQLEMYRQQIAELQRLNAELLAESGRGRTTSCLSWPAAESSSSVVSTDRVNSARLSSAPLTIQIPVRINGFPVFALIDTGSTITVAGRAFASRIGIPSLYQASASHAIGLGGNEVHIAGAAFANICVGSSSLMHRIHFTIGDCTPQGARDYHIILGNDFLSQLPRFSIDYQAETGEDVIPIGKQHVAHMPKVLDIRVSEDTIVPAQSERILACHKQWSTDECDTLFLVTSQNLIDKSLLTAPVLINNKNIKILVTNPSDHDVFLKKNTQAAEAVEVFEDDNNVLRC